MSTEKLSCYANGYEVSWNPSTTQICPAESCTKPAHVEARPLNRSETLFFCAEHASRMLGIDTDKLSDTYPGISMGCQMIDPPCSLCEAEKEKASDVALRINAQRTDPVYNRPVGNPLVSEEEKIVKFLSSKEGSTILTRILAKKVNEFLSSTEGTVFIHRCLMRAQPFPRIPDLSDLAKKDYNRKQASIIKIKER